MTRVLLVGAGAIGRVYGQHLAQGGAEVSVFCRPHHAAELRAGVRVRHVRATRRIDAVFTPHEVLTQLDELEGRTFDQVWLGLPSDALGEPWIDPLITRIGDASLVTLQPGAHVAERLAKAHLVRGAIGILAWASPLAGSSDPREAGPPATSYWFPPLTVTQLASREPHRAEAAVLALRRGGCPSRVVPDVEASLAQSSAIIQSLVAALEACGWSLRTLRRGPGLSRALAAARALVALDAAQRRRSSPLFASLLRAPLLAPLAALAPKLVPFDLERYLEAHFTKVGSQTRVLLAQSVDDARALGVDAEPIEALLADLPRLPAGR